VLRLRCLRVCFIRQNMELVLGDNCVIQAALYCVTLHFGCCCVIHAPMRSKFRSRYGIEGSACGDCCITSFCACCAIAQEAREIKARGVPQRMQMPGTMVVSPHAVVYATPVVNGQPAVMYGQQQQPAAMYAQPRY
jgi:Cys-rich protein (TIGR01571 family)